MEEIISKVKEQVEIITANIDKKDVKAATLRCRKALLELSKVGRDYRKISKEYDKQKKN